MQNITLLLLYSLFLANLLKLLLITSAENFYLYNITSNVTTSNSTYISNLGELASSLRVNASADGYSEQTIGVPPDQVSGLVLCRGDVNVSDCTGCIDRAYGDMTSNGSSQSIPIYAVIWYDYCLFQYSNESTSLTYNSLQFSMWNNQNFTNQTFNGWNTSNDFIMSSINSTLRELLTNVSEHAAFNSTKRFASGMTQPKPMSSVSTGGVILTVTLQQIYGLSQCIPNISNDECRTCLQYLIDELLGSYDGSQGGRIVGVECNLRYEIYPFFSGKPDIQLGSDTSKDNPPPTPSALPPSPSVPPDKSKGVHRRLLGIVISITVVLLFISCFIGILWIRKLRSTDFVISQEEKTLTTGDETLDLWHGEGSSDVPLFDFNQIVNATNNFSLDNKLGQGGFGLVYKGVLQDGLEIAIKRLSACSGQGLTEFRNEIQLIGKLQHRNLVRLVGWSVHDQEKLLVYEFMPNKSLDFFIFDETRAALLDWEKRFEIIEGIAQGLLYLHKHSRLRIVHRDLKASNVLLDSEMNPKISDFGLARIFGPKELEANTNRVVGTYGYMAPEYASEGFFSIKSDVFSYGVLLLEIVSSKRNMGFHQYGHFLNLLGYAWDKWKEGRFFDLICPTLTEVSQRQIERCIHIALLCVQENPADRPTMSDVITFLTTASIVLPEPKQPAYFNVRVTEKAEESSDLDGSSCSIKCVTLTNPEVR